MNFRRISLLWKIWLSTSVALTAMFVAMGVFLERSVQETATSSVQEEVRGSSKTYRALWEARAEQLASLAEVLGNMPVVQKAALTRDPQVIPAAMELWERATAQLKSPSFLLITDAEGEILGASVENHLDPVPVIRKARGRFPSQVNGFLVQNSVLHQVVLTPLYYPGDQASGKLNGVLISGFAVDAGMARDLKEGTGRSEFIFASRGQIYASTLNDHATGTVVRNLVLKEGATLVSDGATEYVPLAQELVDLEGRPLGRLFILRSFDEARKNITALRRHFFFIWEGAVVVGLFLTYLAAERIVKPVKDLDHAASEVAMQNYDHRVAVTSDDELGRLAATFNKMCESLQAARAELIRRERIGTIGRLASSIVHDLRNPLAAIYGGSEMLVDTRPTPEQTKRIAENIYRASRRIQELLDDLVRVTRGKTKRIESCNVHELIRAALAPLEAGATSQSVKLSVAVGEDMEVPGDRPRLEGVFFNLAQNALDVMPGGGELKIEGHAEGGWVTVEVADTGPGIPSEIRSQLFQPFITQGKKNGLGLGLALARQTVLDHGGDLWFSTEEGKGARFYLRLPRNHLI